MAYKYITQYFTDGWDGDMDPVAFDLLGQDPTVVTRVADVENMVFERGLISNRQPSHALFDTGLNDYLFATIAGLPNALDGINNFSTGAILLARTNAGSVYHLWQIDARSNTVFTPTEVTGPGLGTDANWFVANALNYAVVNGAVMIGGSYLGIVHWVPSVVPVYTLIPPPGYVYLTKQGARAVGGYQVAAGPTIGPLTIGWSRPGDETDWTSTTAGAGSTVLTDVSDSITGVKTIKGNILVARNYGFHIGTPTGQAPQPFVWQLHSDNSIGCNWPSSLQVYKNVAFFMSETGIHTFDLVDIQDIGEGVYKEIWSHITDGASEAMPRAWISASYKSDFQPTYNITLSDASASDPVGGTHYMYNIRERKWSTHDYKPNPLVDPSRPFMGFHMNEALSFGGSIRRTTRALQSFLQESNDGVTEKLYLFYVEPLTNISYPMDRNCSFTTGILTPGDPTQDATLERILLEYKVSNTVVPKVVVTYTKDGVDNSLEFLPKDINGAAGQGKWQSTWFNGRCVADKFQITVTYDGRGTIVGPNTPVSFKRMIMAFSDAGIQR